MNSYRYVVITPVRNEADHFVRTIQSMIAQVIPPRQWIIVNDGSNDATGELADQAAAEHKWIHVIHRQDRGFRKPGSGVMEAFYDGYEKITDLDLDFLIKLDGDLEFAPDYFERCFNKFFENEKLGIGGGVVCHRKHGKLMEEYPSDPAFHVRGPTKIYKAACWQDIGPLVRSPGWDTFDEVKANMLGWSTGRFKDVQIITHKPTGSADGSWKNWVKNGRANYIVGYHPLFMLLKCLRRIPYRPYGIGSIGLAYGFISGYIKDIPQVEDRQFVNYLRQQQVRRLLNKKSLWD